MRRVIDCFLLSDEVDLLEVHLRMLEGVVDRFVVVEGDRTFAGVPKSSALLGQAARFAPWWDRIDRVEVRLPASVSSRWDRENAQRAGLGRHLVQTLGADDLVLLGDVDEIVDTAVIASMLSLPEPVRLCLHHACWYADWWLPRAWTNGPIAFHRRHLNAPVVRLQLGENHDDWGGFVERRVTDAGLHLWNVASPAAVRAKWATYSHAEFDGPRYASGHFLERCCDYGITMEGRWLVTALQLRNYPPQLRQLRTLAPDLFSVGSLPPQRQREAFAGYAWCRTRLPAGGLWRVAEGLSTAPVAEPGLAALHRALLRRRLPRVHSDDRWPCSYVSPNELAGPKP